jgi:hypothetical protein
MIINQCDHQKQVSLIQLSKVCQSNTNHTDNGPDQYDHMGIRFHHHALYQEKQCSFYS